MGICSGYHMKQGRENPDGERGSVSRTKSHKRGSPQAEGRAQGQMGCGSARNKGAGGRAAADRRPAGRAGEDGAADTVLD